MAGDQKYWEDGQPRPVGPDSDDGLKYWEDGQPFLLHVEPTDLTVTGTTGIPSGEAFGADGVVGDQNLIGSAGIPSGEAFGGDGHVDQHIVGAAGIASGEAFGATGVIGAQFLAGGDGIISGEAFGADGHVDQHIEGAAGIPSEEGFGVSGFLGQIIGSAGIPSGEAFGSGGIVQTNIQGDTGIPSAEAFGDGSNVPAGVSLVLESGVSGIASGEAFGSDGAVLFGINGLLGIPSAEAFGTTGVVVNLDTRLSPFGLYIDGENKTNYLLVNGIRVDEQSNFSSAATLRMFDPLNAYTPSVGESVLVLYLPPGETEWKRIFGGSIEAVQRRRVPGPDRLETFYDVRCTDFARALSRRRISKKYPEADFGTLSAILADISATFLEPEGITWIDRGDPGIVIPDIEFVGVPLNEALSTLSELVNWDWTVDYSKNFYMYDRPANVVQCPWSITEDETGPNSDIWFDLDTTTDRGLYRNKQFVKANLAATVNSKTVSLTNFESTTIPSVNFFNGYLFSVGEWDGKVERITDVRINGTSVPFYSRPDAPVPGWQFVQYSPRDIALMFNSPSYTPLPLGTVVAVDFVTTSDLPEPIALENSAEIANRAAIEGGTGLYEDVYDAGDITDRDTLLELAQQLLDRFSEMGVEIAVSSDRFGFEVGQEIDVNLPSRGISSGTYLIESISKEEISKTLLRYVLKISNRIQQRDALTAFDRLIKRMRKPAKQSNTTIQFALAQTLPGQTNPGLVTGTSLGGTYIVRVPITLNDIVLFFDTPPTGQSIIIDILVNGVSVFPGGFVCEYPPGSDLVTYQDFAGAPRTLVKDDKVTCNVTQVGSGTPGKDGKVTLNGWS